MTWVSFVSKALFNCPLPINTSGIPTGVENMVGGLQNLMGGLKSIHGEFTRVLLNSVLTFRSPDGAGDDVEPPNR